MAEGELSISCLIEASDKDTARRQVVDLVAICNFAAQSIGILSLLFEMLFLEIPSCPLRNRKPRGKSFALSCLRWGSRTETSCRSCYGLQLCCEEHRHPVPPCRDIVPHISPSPKENVLQKRGLLLKPKTVKSIYPKQSMTVYPIHKSFKAQGIMAQVIRRVNQRSIQAEKANDTVPVM